MDHVALKYLLALKNIPTIGDVTARKLLLYFQSAQTIFEASPKELQKANCLQKNQLTAFQGAALQLDSLEKELAYVEKHNVQVLSVLDAKYPQRLLECNDAPPMLFFQGNCDLNALKTVAIIGTRNHTTYGLETTQKIVEGLTGSGVLIISGLADGIDGIAHKQALNCGIPTLGVLAHGLDIMYPTKHKSLAKNMLDNGGLLTEYKTQTIPDRQNFPMRNRIVAGMSDLIVVIESSETGGAMITAKLGNGYNREVAAVPGRITDAASAGCNYLLRKNMAHTITSAEDILELMNWSTGVSKSKPPQMELFLELTTEEELLITLLKNKGALHFDNLLLETQWTFSLLSNILLGLELKGVVRSIPGKKYDLY